MPVYTYIPFIHEKQKQPESEPLPLYIELVDPRILPPVKKEEEKEERGVVIIQL